MTKVTNMNLSAFETSEFILVTSQICILTELRIWRKSDGLHLLFGSLDYPRTEMAAEPLLGPLRGRLRVSLDFPF